MREGEGGRISEGENFLNHWVLALYTRAPDETRVGVEIGFLATR